MNNEYPPDQQPFDKKLALWRNRMPLALVDACIFVNDTIEMSHAIGKQQFGHKVTQETVMEIYHSIVMAMHKNQKLDIDGDDE